MMYECCYNCPRRKPACSSGCPDKAEADRRKDAYKAEMDKFLDVHAYIKHRHEKIEKKVRDHKQ